MAKSNTTSKLTSLAEEKKDNGYKTMSRDAIAWMNEKVLELKRPDKIATSISRESMRNTSLVRIGMLYCFYYDPKTKDSLDYWDKFPLVLVLEKYDDGFLGLNLHYLPPKFRIAFLTKLMKFAQLTKDGDINRMRISYDILNAAKRYAEFKPCIKRYLKNHTRSRILMIQPNEWDIATLLPLQQFRGARATTVWKDSLQEYREHMAHFNKEEE
jgi:hypothetical protein